MARVDFIRRVSSRILKTGLNKVWIDPQENEKVALAKTREDVRKLIDDKVIIKKLDKFNSKAKARKRVADKKKGRHMGLGKRKGTRNARMPDRLIWIKKIRNMRKTLKEMKKDGKLNVEEYRLFKQQAKGNLFKNKNIMVGVILQKQNEKRREEELENQAKILNINKTE